MSQELIYTNPLTVEQEVYMLLKNYPACRDCDNLLIIKYWEIETGCFFFHPEVSSELTSAESITRARRYIQNVQNIFLPSLAVALNRRFKEELLREHYGYVKVKNNRFD